jgi:hypothetical protein
MLGAQFGMAAVSGFEMYKVVQLAGGSKVSIQFPGKDGKTSPPPPLRPAQRIAIWPDNEGEVHLAERLTAAGKQVISPATVSGILTGNKLPTAFKDMTEADVQSAITTVCRHTRAELVLASRDEGTASNTNGFSFSSANVTAKGQLLAYSCPNGALVWQDQIVMVIEVGSNTPAKGEIMKAASDAWADRVLEAMKPAS